MKKETKVLKKVENKIDRPFNKITYERFEVMHILETVDEISFYVKLRYRTLVFSISHTLLSTEDKKSVDLFNNGTHDIFLILSGKEYVMLERKSRIILKNTAISKFKHKEYEPIILINYTAYGVFTQLDGITTIVGMSGAGKTYSALSMMLLYYKYFDKILYLNYELPERDIVSRLNDMYDKSDLNLILSKLYINDTIMTSLELEEILAAADIELKDRVVFIIDNVGSVIGQQENVYQKQNEFIKQLDTLSKERGWHVLALTQIIKDHNLNLFNEQGDVKDSINMSIMSGSIMLGNLSRSVLFTGYNGATKQFKTKVLKRGTGKYYFEVESEVLTRDLYVTKSFRTN